MPKLKLSGYAKPKISGGPKKRRLIIVCSILLLLVASSGVAKAVTGSWIGAKAAVTLNYNPFYASCDPVPAKRPVLSEGARDTNTSRCVAALQRALNDCCGQGLAEDGVFGPQTRQAVLNFQHFFNTATKDGAVNADIWGGVDYMMAIAVGNAGLTWIEPQEIWNRAHPAPAAPAAPAAARTPLAAAKTNTAPAPSAATGRTNITPTSNVPNAPAASSPTARTNITPTSNVTNPPASSPVARTNNTPTSNVPSSPTPTSIGTPLSSGTVVRAVTIAPTKPVVATHTPSSTPSNPAAAAPTPQANHTSSPTPSNPAVAAPAPSSQQTSTPHSPPARQNTSQSSVPSSLQPAQQNPAQSAVKQPSNTSSNSGCPAGKVKKFTATNKFVCMTPTSSIKAV